MRSWIVNVALFFSIPSLLPTIQNRLLECISAVLSQSHHAQAKSSITPTRANVASTTQHISELSGSALVQIGLQTLAQFNFKVSSLLGWWMFFLSFTSKFLYFRVMICLSLQENLLSYIWKMRTGRLGKMLLFVAAKQYQILSLARCLHSTPLVGPIELEEREDVLSKRSVFKEILELLHSSFESKYFVFIIILVCAL